jgi:hypothetical protein
MEEKDLLDIIKNLRGKGREWKTVDAKQELALTGLGEKAEFVKDVVAMANNGEKSYIVVGLVDGTFADMGTLPRHYQKNDLNQMLADKIDPPATVDYQEFTINGNEYGLIEIIGYNLPYIVARDLVPDRTDRKQTRIYKGMIFVRHEDGTEGISRTELEELLTKRGIKKEFEHETEYAQQLVFERPFAWEYKLTAELLRSKLVPIERKFDELHRGLVYKKTTRIQGLEFFYWVRSKCDDLANLIGIASKVLTEEIPASWGEPGVPGEPLEIKHAVDKLTSVCNELVEWETDVRFVIISDAFASLKQRMEGWTSQIFDEIDNVPEQLTEPFKQPDPRGVYNVQLVFKEPPGLAEAMVELQNLQNDPQKLLQVLYGF